MFTNVPGVPAAPPTTGLVASAAHPDVQRWEQGMAWIPERCGTTYQLVPWCDAPAGTYTHPHPGAAYHRPVGLRIADECTTLGGPVDYERVRRVADAQAPFIVARELWTGALSATDPYLVGAVSTVNAHLASSDAVIVGSGGASLTVGFGRLEQAALETSHGQPVMIHVPVLLLPQIANSYLIRDTGDSNILTTWAGNTIVADGGYPGTGPAGQAVGATAWCYATSPVAVLESPWDIAENDAWNVHRDINLRTVWATRVFAATFDPCVHLATEITI